WTSTYPRQMAMASSSLAPMRRSRISLRPALASKYHLPLRFTIGTGYGQSSLPTERKDRLRFFGSGVTRVFSFALAENVAALCLSCVLSAVSTSSAPPGPRISSRAGTSYFSAASIKAAAASCEVANPFCLTGGLPAAPTTQERTITQTDQRILGVNSLFGFTFIFFSSKTCLLIFDRPRRAFRRRAFRRR